MTITTLRSGHCEQCGQTYSGSRGLRTHVSRKHRVLVAPMPPSINDRTMPAEATLILMCAENIGARVLVAGYDEATKLEGFHVQFDVLSGKADDSLLVSWSTLPGDSDELLIHNYGRRTLTYAVECLRLRSTSEVRGGLLDKSAGSSR